MIKQSSMEIDSSAWTSLSLCLASARDWCTRYGVTLSLTVKGGKFEAKATKHEPMPGNLRSSRRWKRTGTGSAGDVIQALMREVQHDEEIIAEEAKEKRVEDRGGNPTG